MWALVCLGRLTLQVAMHDAEAVQVAHRVHQHREVRLKPRPGGPFGLDKKAGVHQQIEQLLLRGLHHQVVAPLGGVLVDHADDMLVAPLALLRAREGTHLVHHRLPLFLHLNRYALVLPLPKDDKAVASGRGGRGVNVDGDVELAREDDLTRICGDDGHGSSNHSASGRSRGQKNVIYSRTCKPESAAARAL
eukprot:6079852-Prymnesium_polylepis.1